MALSRSFLSALGIEQDKINEIINAHSETVSGLKSEMEDYKKTAEQLATVEADYEKLKADTKDYAELKEKYEKEHSDFEAYKKEVATKEQTEKLEEAYKALLLENKVGEAHIESILGVTDLSKMELDEDGKLKGVDELNNVIKKKWGGFITTTETKGSNPETPPKGGRVKMTRDEIMAIKDTAKRQKAIEDNIELFQ